MWIISLHYVSIVIIRCIGGKLCYLNFRMDTKIGLEGSFCRWLLSGSIFLYEDKK